VRIYLTMLMAESSAFDTTSGQNLAPVKSVRRTAEWLRPRNEIAREICFR